MNIDGMWLASIIILPLSFLGMMVFGFANFHDNFKEKFSILNMFPYELSFHNQGRMMILFRFFLYLFSAVSISPALLMIVKYINYSGYMPYLVMIAIVFAISSLTFLSLNIVQAKFVMIHTILVTAYFSLGILSAGASAIFLFNVNSGPELMTIGIIEAALGVILLLAMFNPRLRTWANLETIKNEDGSMSVVRPKFFILAFSEWLAIFLHLAIQIVFLVSYLWY